MEVIFARSIDVGGGADAAPDDGTPINMHVRRSDGVNGSVGWYFVAPGVNVGDVEFVLWGRATQQGDAVGWVPVERVRVSANVPSVTSLAPGGYFVQVVENDVFQAGVQLVAAELRAASQRELHVGPPGLPEGWEDDDKFGANATIGTGLAVVTSSGTYQMPSAPVGIEVLSSAATDTAGGVGARAVTLEGIGLSGGVWTAQQETLAMDGVTPVQSSLTWLRVVRVHVSASGRYADVTAGSHDGTITVRSVAPDTDDIWATVPLVSGYGVGQSQIGCVSVPENQEMYLQHLSVDVESGKPVTFLVLSREGADVASAPYAPMRLNRIIRGAAGSINKDHHIPRGPFVGPCDIVTMAVVTSGTAAVSVNFETLRRGT